MSLYLLTHLQFQFPLPDALFEDRLPAREDRSKMESLRSPASPAAPILLTFRPPCRCASRCRRNYLSLAAELAWEGQSKVRARTQCLVGLVASSPHWP